MICLSRKLRLLFSLICISHMQEAEPSGLKTSLRLPTNVWIPYISLGRCLMKLYSTTLRCIYVFLYTEQAYGGNVFSPHTLLSHRLTKEHHQEHSLFPSECDGLCWAAPVFFEHEFSCASLLNAVSSACKRPGRISEEGARAGNRSEEREEPQASTRDFWSHKNPPPLTYSWVFPDDKRHIVAV